MIKWFKKKYIRWSYKNHKYDNCCRYEDYMTIEMSKELCLKHYKKLIELDCVTNVNYLKTNKGYIVFWSNSK